MEDLTNSSMMRAEVLEEYNSPLRLTHMARPKAGESGKALGKVAVEIAE